MFAANRGVLDKVTGGFIVADTAAVIEAKLAAFGADVANIKSIVATDATVRVSEAVFAANRGVLDKVAGGFIVSDTAINIQANLVALGADVAYIRSMVATNAPPTVPIAQFDSFGALLNKLSGGFSISDTAANIGAALTSLVADNGHLATITATGGPLTVSAAAFLADETTLNKVIDGIEIADTTTHFAADALQLLADFGHVRAVAFTDPGAPAITLTVAQATQAQPLLAKIVSGYVLNETSASGVTTLGHGDNLTIAAAPGDDTITGGGVNETFVFGDNFDHAVLTDFSSHISGAGHDIIQLAKTDYGSFSLLTQNEASPQGANVSLKGASGDVLVIENLTLGALNGASADFKFA